MLDVLRGFALLGILVMNIQSFSMPSPAYVVPTAWGDLEGGNFVVWLIAYLFFDQRFITIFSVLFGAGIVLLAERNLQAGRPPASIHYRRMAALFAIGLLHAYLVWYGDILLIYAVCGSLAYLVWRLSPASLAVLGGTLYALPSGFLMLLGIAMVYAPADIVAELQEYWSSFVFEVDEEVAAFRGSWLEQMPARFELALEMHTKGMLIAIPGITGLMLLGMAAIKWGWLTGKRPQSSYVVPVWLALCVGLPLAVVGAIYNFAIDWDYRWQSFGFQFGYWAAPVMSAGWIGLVVLLVRAGVLGWLEEALAAVGRLALSNYLLQSLICTTIFYGHGFGLFGEVSRVGQVGFVLLVWLIQVPLSVWWFRGFGQGPVERLLRKIAYGGSQSIAPDRA